jgi:hypothetical protein
MLLGFIKKFWWDTPAFMFELETSLEHDPAVVSGLSEITGYVIYFDRESTHRVRPFEITVCGKCPQSQVTLKGVFYLKEGAGYQYKLQDTTATWCK